MPQLMPEQLIVSLRCMSLRRWLWSSWGQQATPQLAQCQVKQQKLPHLLDYAVPLTRLTASRPCWSSNSLLTWRKKFCSSLSIVAVLSTWFGAESILGTDGMLEPYQGSTWLTGMTPANLPPLR